MRNLKRALSLTLASVMLLGMMVVGAGAAGFPDVDDEDNVEAIEVLNAVEVILGYDNGDFGPDDLVTRAQMAVIMAKLLNLDYQYYEATCPFTDVPAWARGYVGACYAKGITSGYSATIYGPNDGITPVQAASMMMRALGYFQYAQDYNAGFEVATVSQGTDIGIFKGVGSSASAAMTRNQVAKMALNALCAEMVTFTGTPGMEVNGVTVGYRPEYTSRTSTEIKYQAIESRTSDVSGGNNLNRGQYYIQLGEELYDGKLTRKFERDEFERPSINWQYNGKEIGTYVNYELKTAEFLTGVTGAQMYDELTYTTINDNDLLTYVDGVDSDIQKGDLVRSNKNDLTGTGTGVLTEVFVDLSRDEITITSINTWLAKANSDYNSTNDSLSLKVFTNRDKAAKVSSSTKIVDGAKVAAAENVKKDEYKLVYMSGKDNTSVYNDYARFDVVKIFDAEILPETAVTKWAKSDTKVSGDFTADGTVYKTNEKAYYDGGNVLYDYNETLLTDMSYNVYLDRYGNAIGVDLAEGTKNYVFITGYDRVGSNISVKTADAAAIFLDGTMDVIKVNVKDTNKYIEKIEDTNANFVQWTDNRSGNGWLAENRWYTYTVNNSGVYTLKPAERMFYTDYTDAELGSDNAKILNSANLYVDDSRDDKAGTPSYTNLGRAYGNDDSIYITVEADSVDHSGNGGIDKDAIVDVNGVYTGAQNVKLEVKRSNKEQVAEAYVYTVYDSSYYIIASIVLGDAQGTAANYAYILGDAKNERVEYESSSARASGDATYYWEFDAVLNGEKQTLTAKSKYNSTILGLKKFHVQELRYDGDYVTNIVDVKADKVMDSNQTMEKIDKMDVYDVGHVAAVDAFGEKVHTGCTSHSGNAYGYSDHRLDGTIELVGRTLYTERVKGGNNKYDVGLALASDAKAVLVQIENGKEVATQCSSVSEAIGRLADADTRNVPAAEGIQFQGRIVAVLKDGIAQWVVIISDTELRTNDKDYNSGTKSYLTWDKIDQEWDLKVPDSEWVANPTTTQIARWLERAGCSNVSKTRDGWNFTFEGYDYTNQYINVLEPVVADTYTVTVADAANGKVSVSPKGKLEKGTEVTISATGNTGYVVDKITVETEAGAPVTVTGNKFTMPAANVTVTVTFKKTASEGSIVVSPKGTALAENHYSMTGLDANNEIAIGKTFTINALKKIVVYVDGARTVVEKGDTFDVTAAEDLSVVINRTKWAPGENNSLTEVEDTNSDTPVATPSMARFARAIRAAVEYQKMIITDVDGKAHEYIVKVETGADGMRTIYFPSAKSVAEAADILNAADAANKEAEMDFETATDKEIEDNWGDVPTPADSNIKVELNEAAPYVAKISEYVPTKGVAVDGLTKAEVVAALTAAAKANGKDWTFTEDGIDFTAGTATVTGTAIKVSLKNAASSPAPLGGADKNVPTQVWKVTYPGGETLVQASDMTSGKSVTNVLAGVRALLPEATKFEAASAGVAVASSDPKKPGTASVKATLNPDYANDSTLSQYVDTKYEAAVVLMSAATSSTGLKAGGVIQDGEGTPRDLLVATVIDPATGVKVGLTPAYYVQAGTIIYFSAGSELTTPVNGKYAHAGKSVTLTVDGKTKLTFAVGADGSISGDKMTYTVPSTTNAATLTFGVALTAPTADVMVDGVKVERKDTGVAGDPSDDTLVIPNMKGYSLIYKDTDDGEWKNIAPAAVDVDGVATVAASSLGSLKVPVENGALQLKRGYSVAKEGTATLWKAYTMDEDGNLTALAAPAYYPVGTTEKVYIEGKDANTILAKANSTAMPGNYYQVLKGEDGTTKAVWEVPVAGNIGADDYAALITVTTADATNYGKLTGALVKDAKNTITINAGTASKYVTLGQVITGVTGKFVSDDEDVLKSSSVKVTVTVAKNKDIIITWISDTAVDRPAAGGDDLTLGKLVLDFGTYELSLEDITLTVPKSTT